MNIRNFMKPELKNKEPITYPGVETFKDENGEPIPFIIRPLDMKEMNAIRSLYRTREVYRDPRNNNRPIITNGQVAVLNDYDSEKAGLAMMVAAFVQPKLDDHELMEYYGVVDKLDMPYVLFGRKDFEYANKCLSDACGLNTKDNKSEKETIAKVKN